MATATVRSSETIFQIAEFEIQAAWQAYQTVEKHGLDFGKVCYDQRAKGEVVQGGTTFSRTLDKLGIPRRTAYYWIHSYEISIGVREPKPEKVVPSSPLAGVQMKRADFLRSAALAVETNSVPDAEELAALLAPLESEPEPASEPIEAPATEILPPESDTVRLRRFFKGTNIEVKQSIHGNKFLLDGLSFAQCREIATMLVNE